MTKSTEIGQNKAEFFVPLINSDCSFVYAIHRSRLTPQLLSELILAFDANVSQDKLQRHVQFLMDRIEGTPFLLNQHDYCTLKTKSIRKLIERFDLPVHYFILQDRKCRWTVDVFNPKNAECRLPIHDPNYEYIEVIIEKSGFLPYSPHMSYWEPYESLVDRHASINCRLLDVFKKTQPAFVFGSAVGHLGHLSLLFHFGKGKSWRRASYDEYLWQFAIYTENAYIKHEHLAKLASEASDDLRQEQKHINWDRPELSLRVQRIADSTICVWSPVMSGSVEDRYEERLGLAAILSHEIKRYPTS